MNQAGISHREIARQFDRSESLVRNVVRRLTTEEELECKLSILDEQMRSSDDPDKNWPVGDILDALRLRKATRKALIGHLNAKENDLISLRRLMNVVIEEDIDPWSDTPWPILFKVRNIGIKGYRSILGGIGRLQLGEKCRREWEQIAKAFLERHLNQ